MGVTEKLARFVTDTQYDELPPEAVTAAKRAVLDTLAVTIAGCREDPELRQALQTVHHDGQHPSRITLPVIPR